MISPERLRRRRCIALRIAVFFAVLLVAYDWGDWAVMSVAVAGGLVAVGAYWRDCRASKTKSSQTDTNSGDGER
jgi:hypothetical protein